LEGRRRAVREIAAVYLRNLRVWSKYQTSLSSSAGRFTTRAARLAAIVKQCRSMSAPKFNILILFNISRKTGVRTSAMDKQYHAENPEHEKPPTASPNITKGLILWHGFSW
jgi:hypothetical protein